LTGCKKYANPETVLGFAYHFSPRGSPPLAPVTYAEPTPLFLHETEDVKDTCRSFALGHLPA